LTIDYKLSKRHGEFNDRVPPGRIHIMKLTRELLPTEKSTKKKMPVPSESWVRHDFDLKLWENGVSELGHSPSLIDSTAHSHTEGTGTAME
jgi:hypothetical protein